MSYVTRFAGKDVAFSIPYSMFGAITVANNTLGVPAPEATFLHNVDKPGSFARVLIRITAFNNATPAVAVNPVTQATVNDVLDKYVRVMIRDTSKNEQLTKASTLINLLLQQNTRAWEFERPYTLVRSEGFEVTIDNLLVNFVVNQETIANLRIELCFQGELIVIAPPSETR